MLEEATLWRLVEARAEATPEAPMAVDDRDRGLSFAGYHAACLDVAGALGERGIGPGTLVSWMLPTRLEALVLVGALARLGAVQNPILPIYRTREVRFIASQARPAWLITPSLLRGFDAAAMAREIASETPGLATLVVDEGLPGAPRLGLPAAGAGTGVPTPVPHLPPAPRDPPGGRAPGPLALLQLRDDRRPERRPPHRRLPLGRRPGHGPRPRPARVGPHRLRLPLHPHRRLRLAPRRPRGRCLPDPDRELRRAGHDGDPAPPRRHPRHRRHRLPRGLSEGGARLPRPAPLPAPTRLPGRRAPRSPSRSTPTSSPSSGAPASARAGGSPRRRT
jgi:hypothetical protein